MASQELYTGVCIGGPMNGQVTESRFPRGFVLINVPNERVWVYDRKENHDRHEVVFIARAQVTLDNDKAWSAAQGADFDVRAYDDGTKSEEVGL